MLCGCCGNVYRKIDELTHHVNMEGFHLRLSEIPEYDKHTFSVEEYSAQQRDRNALVEAAAMARQAAAAARREPVSYTHLTLPTNREV